MTVATTVASAGPSNTPKQLIAFFSIPSRPVTVPEFSEFWKSLDDEQKQYYRLVELPV